jgi:flavin-dependent dehydrogenase
MVILGAGMAGCLAACIFTDATILEAKTEIGAGHQALLRFRSPQIGEYVGIEFKQVTVHKSIWEGGRDVAPSPRLLNK